MASKVGLDGGNGMSFRTVIGCKNRKRFKDGSTEPFWNSVFGIKFCEFHLCFTSCSLNYPPKRSLQLWTAPRHDQRIPGIGFPAQLGPATMRFQKRPRKGAKLPKINPKSKQPQLDLLLLGKGRSLRPNLQSFGSFGVFQNASNAQLHASGSPCLKLRCPAILLQKPPQIL